MAEKFGKNTKQYQDCVSHKKFKDMSGEKHNDLLVTKLWFVEKKLPRGWRKFWICECVCGNKDFVVNGDSLVQELTTSCGCKMRNSRAIKTCAKCRVDFPNTSEFFCKDKCFKTTGLDSWCRECRYADNRPKLKKLRDRERAAVLEKLCGNDPKCKCCNERRTEFLTIDHIDRDGKAHRKSAKGSYVSQIVKGIYKGRLRILCYNCNSGRERTKDKRCPHEIERAEAFASALCGVA